VAPFVIAELLQTGGNILLPADIAGRVCCPIMLFALAAGKRRLDKRVLETMPLSTHAARHLYSLKGLLLNPPHGVKSEVGRVTKDKRRNAYACLPGSVASVVIGAAQPKTPILTSVFIMIQKSSRN